MKTKHIVCVILFIIVLTTIFLIISQKTTPPFECTDAIGCVTIRPGEPLKLGVLHDLSGGAAAFGTDQVNSTRIALDDRGGQVLGHPVELLVLDEKCTAEHGRTGMLRIVADPQIVGVLGTTCSGAAVIASKIMSEAGLVMISGSNSGFSLTSVAGKPAKDWYPGYFRTNQIQQAEVRASALYAFHQSGVKHVAVVSADEVFNRGSAEIFKKTFTEQGGKIVLDVQVNQGESNMTPVLTAVKRSDADMLYMALYPPEAVPLVRQARMIKELDKMIIFGAGAVVRKDFLSAVGQSGIGLYSISNSLRLEGRLIEEFLSKYKQKYGKKPQTTNYPYAYDAVNLLMRAIELTATVQKDGTIIVGRQALRDAICATSGFEGLSGRLSCDSFGDCGIRLVSIIRFDDPSGGLEGFRANILDTFSPDDLDHAN